MDGPIYSPACRDRFEVDPAAFVRVCPFCGMDTAIRSGPNTLRLGRFSLDELETLIRNDWRCRLGRQAYHRRHSRALIRALIVFALKPKSPTRRAVVERHLSDALAELRAHGLDRQQIASEFLALSRAAWDALSTSGLPLKRASALMRAIDAQILDGMDWPDAILEVIERERAAGEGR